MVVSVEWRINEGTDAIVVVDAIALKVAEVATLDVDVLKDYLTVTVESRRALDTRYVRRWRRQRISDFVHHTGGA